MAELLGMHEVPDRVVVNFQAALAQLHDQSTQREITRMASLDQPVSMLTRNHPRLVTAHPPRCHAAGLPKAFHPLNRRADPHAKISRRLMARHSATSHTP